MRLRILALSVCLGIAAFLAVSAAAPGRPAFPWPEGKRAAISLTFDDARLSQVDVGLPLLDKLGVKATFYVNPDGVKDRIDGWRQAVKNGHEIGNHTVNHPCTGNYDFAKDHALENMTLADIKKEIVDADRILGDLLGIKPESFAYPCCQMFVGRGRNLKTYVPMVAERFLTARMGGDDAGNDPSFCDLSQLMAGGSDDATFEKLKPMIDQTIAEGRWLILCGHEVGDAGFQITSTATLEAICRYAKDPGNGLWIDTVSRIGRYVNDHRKL